MLVLKSTFDRLKDKATAANALNTELRVKLEKFRAERGAAFDRISDLEKQVEYWKTLAESERDLYRERVREENGTANMERAAAILLADHEDEEPPVPGALRRDDLMNRIDEIYGDGLTVEEMIARRERWVEEQEQES